MSAVIHNFIVHQLVVNQAQELELIKKHSCFDVTPEIEQLAEQINQAFNAKPGKGVGGFLTGESDVDEVLKENSQQFRQWLSDLGDSSLGEEDRDFLGFSQRAADKLKKTLLDFATIETGFLVFCHYEFLATDYLMVALLTTKQHAQINASLELTYSDHLDLAKMQLAVRIDLTQLRINADQQRYISFIKGRMGRKVSDFFMAFLGCEELVDVKQQNKQLIAAVDDYIAVEGLDPTEKQQTRDMVSDYYKEKLEMGEDIQLRELADKLPKSDSGNDFMAFNQQVETPLEENFQADRAALKSLAKFTGQGGGISLSFDRKLYGDRVQYDAQNDRLVIHGIPPNLKDQLLKSQG